MKFSNFIAMPILFHALLHFLKKVDKKLSLKVKVKLSLSLTKHHAMKSYWGSGGIVPRII
jgi:hypothetical protein